MAGVAGKKAAGRIGDGILDERTWVWGNATFSKIIIRPIPWRRWPANKKSPFYIPFQLVICAKGQEEQEEKEETEGQMRTIICNKSIQSRLTRYNCALLQDCYLHVGQIKHVIWIKLCKWKSDPGSRPLQTSSGDLSLCSLTLTPSLRDHHMRSSDLPQAQHIFCTPMGRQSHSLCAVECVTRTCSRQVKRIQKIEKRFIQVASGSTAAVRRQKASLFPECLNLSQAFPELE